MALNIQDASNDLRETIDAIASLKEEELQELAKILQSAQKANSFIWTAGNGGSASTAAHLSCDVGKGVGSTHLLPFRTIAINEQMISQSAWANDYGFEHALTNQLKNLSRPGDVLICISGSGNSQNIVNAARYAKENEIKVVNMLGIEGGAISQFSDFEIRVKSADMQVIENVHLVIVHWLFKALVNS
jgi:D-sedoheptulose 7-phosphate isomerase